MPLYEYECESCGETRDQRRSFAERSAPLACSWCGRPMAPLFTPNNQIHIPVHFKSVRQGGAEGNYSWSDFHGDTSEKDLAKIKEINGRPVEIFPTREFMSMAGTGKRTSEQRIEAREKDIEAGLTVALHKARESVGPAPPEE